ncbi:hypothetical protein BKA82DRAFT_4446032 [Pisolithus tinctorius]|nr:hypothetical protein BKA82DRAFT_4446032 [Pisolithus tinctorius]
MKVKIQVKEGIPPDQWHLLLLQLPPAYMPTDRLLALAFEQTGYVMSKKSENSWKELFPDALYSFLPDLPQPLALRNLKLVNFVPTPELATATPTTLDLTFYGHPNWTAITPIPLLIPAQLLTILLLTSYTTSQMLLPDPVELPLLGTLILALDN